MSFPDDVEVLTSSLRADGSFIDFALARRPMPQIEKPNEIIIRMEATPINPSDLGVIFGMANRQQATQASPKMLSVPVAPEVLDAMKMTPYGTDRTKEEIIPGNEGSGVVVAAGNDANAKALIGRTVAVFGNGGCYASFRKAKVGNAVNVMPNGVSPQQAACSFVNPLTVLGFVDTMKSEGHAALVHTAAASQLGQMLLRVCVADGISLINIVRKPEQAAILKAIDPNALCVDQTSRNFQEELAELMKQSNATLAFDATGGGSLASSIIAAFTKSGQTRDGVQCYHYGMLDTSPSTLTSEERTKTSFWLLPNWQMKNRDKWGKNMQRVAKEITTTFRTNFSVEIGMSQAVTLSALQVYGQQATGQKYLLNPQKSTVANL